MAKSPQFLLRALFLLVLFINSNAAPSKCKLYNIGDSNTDTGSTCTNPSLQSDKFGPLCRPSDGLLYLDYLCEKLGIDRLVPYLNNTGLDFTSGVNFAVYGSLIETGISAQVDQFALFQELRSKGKNPCNIKHEFQNAIFSIDIGQNDCLWAFGNPVIDEKIQELVQQIENATKRLFQLGGRKFIIYNTGPLGYLPLVNPSRKDIYNNIAITFNEDLSSSCMKLTSELKDATIIYADMYSIKQDLITHSSTYGFESASVPCNGQNDTICRTVFWDTAHYSDAANKIVASKIWTGEYLSPHIKMKDLCDMGYKN